MEPKVKAKRVRLANFVTCPFCGYTGVHTGNPFAWCAGCHVRYTVGNSWVTFDPNMRARSMGEALAMAMSKAGGVRIGGK